MQEAKAREKAEELSQRRDSMLRKQRRLSRAAFSDGEAEDDDELQPESGDELLPDGEQLDRELIAVMEDLQALRPRQPTDGSTPTVTATATVTAEATATAAAVSGASTGVHKRKGTSRVWLAFDRNTNRCCLPHPRDRTRQCGAPPKGGTGTSGHLAHLQTEHAEEWVHILRTGEVKTTVQMIEHAFAAKIDESKPALGDKETAELNRLVALWITKCGRSQVISEDEELRTLLARMLELCKAKLRYQLPCRETVRKEIRLLGSEGKALGRDFIVRLIKSGVKPSISGDLWSESGMGLFGIFAHGITETWQMEKALIGLVACEKERHTAENITKWTGEALKDIGLTSEGLLAPAQE